MYLFRCGIFLSVQAESNFKNSVNLIFSISKGGNVSDTPFTCSMFFGHVSERTQNQHGYQSASLHRTSLTQSEIYFSAFMIKVSPFYKLPLRNFNNSPAPFIQVFEVVSVVAFVTPLQNFLVTSRGLSRYKKIENTLNFFSV